MSASRRALQITGSGPICCSDYWRLRKKGLLGRCCEWYTLPCLGLNRCMVTSRWRRNHLCTCLFAGYGECSLALSTTDGAKSCAAFRLLRHRCDVLKQRALHDPTANNDRSQVQQGQHQSASTAQDNDIVLTKSRLYHHTHGDAYIAPGQPHCRQIPRVRVGVRTGSAQHEHAD